MLLFALLETTGSPHARPGPTAPRPRGPARRAARERRHALASTRVPGAAPQLPELIWVLRRQIAAGSYLTAHKLDVAAERLTEMLCLAR